MPGFTTESKNHHNFAAIEADWKEVSSSKAITEKAWDLPKRLEALREEILDEKVITPQNSSLLSRIKKLEKAFHSATVLKTYYAWTLNRGVSTAAHEFGKAHINDIDYLARTGLLTAQTFYDNSAKSKGDLTHSLGVTAEGKLTILKEGKQTLISDLKNQFTWDKSCKILRETSGQKWLYSMQGLQPFANDDEWITERYQLSEIELRAVQKEAALFYETYQDTTPNVPKNCVLQIVLNSRVVPGQSKIEEGLDFAHGSHAAVHLIDEKGAVIMYGKSLFPKNLMIPFGATAKAITSSHDLELNDESVPRMRRVVMSIPISKDQLLNNLEMAKTENKENISLLWDNCGTFAAEQLNRSVPKHAQVKMDVSIFSVIQNVLGKWTDVPVIKPIKTEIKRLHSGTVRALKMVVPQFIITAFRKLAHAFQSILKFAFAPLLWLFWQGISRGKIIPGATKNSKTEKIVKRWNPFAENLYTVHHPIALLRYMAASRSTHIEMSGERSFSYIVPKELTKEESELQQAHLNRIAGL